MKQKQVTIFGGSGFLGKYVVQKLVKAGYAVNIVARDPENARDVLPCGPVGQITLTKGNITNVDVIKKNVANADIVINLVGVLYSKGKQNFAALHAQGAENIAKYADKAGVKRLVQVSALGIDKAKANYAKTKLIGEKAVLKAFKDATIVRPSIMFGAEDNFFNQFAKMAKYMPFLPLIGGGKTNFQPVYVGDVATAIVKIIADKKTRGKVYELGGPEVVSFKQILVYILKTIRLKRHLLNIPFSLAKLQATFFEMFPVPLLTKDQVNLLKCDNVVSATAHGFKDLKIEPKPIEAVVPNYLSYKL